MLTVKRRLLLTARRVRATPCCSSSSEPNDSSRTGDKYPQVVPPYYRKAHRLPNKSLNVLQDQFPNAGDLSGRGPRLHDYKCMGDLAAAMPTVQEKVDFVSPYERPWKRFERTWHRVHHPRLVAPRKAWFVDPVTQQYDSLEFYKYITKTKTEEDVDVWHYHQDIKPPTAQFQKKLTETLACKLQSQPRGTAAERVAFSNVFLQHLLEDALHSVTSEHLQAARVSYAARCESFWVRSGFQGLYGKEFGPRITGDDRRKLGELAFVCRDTFAAQIRTTNPLRPLFPLNDTGKLTLKDSETTDENDLEETEENEHSYRYSPKAMGMWPDEEPLWMAPGYEMDSREDHRFGLVALRDSSAIEERCAYWGVDETDAEVKQEMYIAMAVVSLFSWLNGQAHALGFTQYNDLSYPLVSQMILSDGKQFFFAVGQLNTLAINADVVANDRWNRCWFDGPHTLYDKIDQDGRFFHLSGEDQTETEGLNPDVLSRILKMLLLRPTPDEDLVHRNLTPFIPDRVQQDDRDAAMFNVFKSKA